MGWKSFLTGAGAVGFAIIGLLILASGPASAQSPTLKAPKVVLQGVPFDVVIEGISSSEGLAVDAGGQRYLAVDKDGVLIAEGVTLKSADESLVLLDARGASLAELAPNILPAWISLLPSFLQLRWR